MASENVLPSTLGCLKIMTYLGTENTAFLYTFMIKSTDRK